MQHVHGDCLTSYRKSHHWVSSNAFNYISWRYKLKFQWSCHNKRIPLCPNSTPYLLLAIHFFYLAHIPKKYHHKLSPWSPIVRPLWLASSPIFVGQMTMRRRPFMSPPSAGVIGAMTWTAAWQWSGICQRHVMGTYNISEYDGNMIRNIMEISQTSFLIVGNIVMIEKEEYQ